MPKENNKMQVDIDNLKKQNVNDLLSIKELYSKLGELGEKITQIKYIDNTLVKKLKKDYENLKKQILDENIQVELNNKIEETKNVQVELNNKIEETKTELNEVNSQMEHVTNWKAVKYQLDSSGKTDTSQNFNNLLANENYIYLPKGNYKVSDLIFSNKSLIGEIGTKIIVDVNKDTKDASLVFNGKNYVENIEFEVLDTSTRTTLVRLENCNDNIFINCKFNAFKNTVSSTKNPLDLFRNNQNISFINCTFNSMSDGKAGGVWIRNYDSDIEKTTSNISFNNCIFNKKGGDEVLAIWGWKGYIDGVFIKNCTLNGYESTTTPSHFISAGICGTSNNLIFDGCKLYINYIRTVNGSSIFKSYKAINTGDADHGKIGDSCKIINSDIIFNLTSDTKTVVFNGDHNYWDNYIIDNCNIKSTHKLQQVTYKVSKITNCKIYIPSTTDAVFNHTSNVSYNDVNIFGGGCKLMHGDTSLYSNYIYMKNTSNVILLHLLASTSYKYEIINNTIILNFAGQIVNANDNENISLNITIKDNFFKNLGVYINTNSESKLKFLNNDIETISTKTVAGGTPIIANNIIDGALKVSAL